LFNSVSPAPECAVGAAVVVAAEGGWDDVDDGRVVEVVIVVAGLEEVG